MFGRHVKDGIELNRLTEGHWDENRMERIGRKPTGKTYWKLAIPCAFCGDLIDECLCFDTEEQMEAAKVHGKAMGYTCSSKCFYKIMDAKNFESWVKAYNDSDENCEKLDGIDTATKIEILADWFDTLGEYDDSPSMSEDLGAEECPI